MSRRVRCTLALFGSLCLLARAPGLSQVSEAAWTDRVHAKGTFTAGTVSPATALQCTVPSLGSVRFTWTAPVGGVTRTGYSWTLTGASNNSGTLAASATTVTVSVSLVTLGSSTFRVRATAAGGWTSTAATGTVNAVSALLVNCSVP